MVLLKMQNAYIQEGYDGKLNKEESGGFCGFKNVEKVQYAYLKSTKL